MAFIVWLVSANRFLLGSFEDEDDEEEDDGSVEKVEGFEEGFDFTCRACCCLACLMAKALRRLASIRRFCSSVRPMEEAITESTVTTCQREKERVC